MHQMKKSTVLVRDIQEHELPELLALLKAKAEFDGAADSLVADLPTLRVALFSHKPMANALVALSAGTIVGMATYYGTFSSFIAKPCLWLDDLYVDEAYRSKGIDRALVKHLSALAHEQGCGRIDWVVSTHNDQGKKFYAGLGASVLDSVQLARLDEAAIHALAHEGA